MTELFHELEFVQSPCNHIRRTIGLMASAAAFKPNSVAPGQVRPRGLLRLNLVAVPGNDIVIARCQRVRDRIHLIVHQKKGD